MPVWASKQPVAVVWLWAGLVALGRVSAGCPPARRKAPAQEAWQGPGILTLLYVLVWAAGACHDPSWQALEREGLICAAEC